MAKQVAAPTNEQVADVLEKALALMNSSGAHWVQQAFRSNVNADGVVPSDGEATYCTIGAINIEAGIEVDDDWRDLAEPEYFLRDASVAALAHGMTKGDRFDQMERIEKWNDNPKRKWADVEARFNRTIARLRKKPDEEARY